MAKAVLVYSTKCNAAEYTCANAYFDIRCIAAYQQKTPEARRPITAYAQPNNISSIAAMQPITV